MLRFFIYLLLTIGPVLSYSQEYILDGNQISGPLSLNKHLLTFEDTTGLLDFSSVSNPEFSSCFSLKRSDLKYKKNATIWIKFSIRNNSETFRSLLIFLNDWDVSVWAKVKDSTIYMGHMGIFAKHARPESYLGENLHSMMVSNIPSGDMMTYYVKTPGFLHNRSYFVSIQDLESHAKRIQSDLLAIGVFSGCFFFIFLATFFLFTKSLKWRNIFYAIYCIGCFLFFSGYYGIDLVFSTEWPISYTLLLPVSSLFYLLFVYNFLDLGKIKFQGRLFYLYIILLSAGLLFLLYAYTAHRHAIYYNILLTINTANILFTVFSLIIVFQVPGKPKYFIFAGIFFLLLGGGTYWYLKDLYPDQQSSIYPMMGSMMEMVTFLIGNFYVLNMEHRQSIKELHEKEKELERNKEQLMRFASIIKEKNKLIADFEDALDANAEQLHGTANSNPPYSDARDRLMQSTILTPDEWTEFRRLFTQVYPGFLGEIRRRYPDLTENEERFLALTKLNLTNREIASMIGISKDSVYKSRYRLSKKLHVTLDNIDSIVTSL